MSFYYKCMKCRTRNTFNRQLDQYIRRKKCRNCNHWNFYVDKERQYRTDYCRCNGYHYTHRKGSPYCEHNPSYELNMRVGRYGEKPVDVLLDIAWDAPAGTGIPLNDITPF